MYSSALELGYLHPSTLSASNKVTILAHSVSIDWKLTEKRPSSEKTAGPSPMVKSEEAILENEAYGHVSGDWAESAQNPMKWSFTRKWSLIITLALTSFVA